MKTTNYFCIIKFVIISILYATFLDCDAQSYDYVIKSIPSEKSSEILPKVNPQLPISQSLFNAIVSMVHDKESLTKAREILIKFGGKIEINKQEYITCIMSDMTVIISPDSQCNVGNIKILFPHHDIYMPITLGGQILALDIAHRATKKSTSQSDNNGETIFTASFDPIIIILIYNKEGIECELDHGKYFCTLEINKSEARKPTIARHMPAEKINATKETGRPKGDEPTIGDSE